MLNRIKFFLLFFLCFSFFFACQKQESFEKVVFDNSILKTISINAKDKEIIISHQVELKDPFIDHVMNISPSKRIVSWLENNINNFGNENKLIINIKEASISREEKQREVKVSGVVKKQNEYFYEINFLVSFVLYDDTDQVLSTVNTNVTRSTTSSKFISLNERDYILDNITLNSLKDLSKKSVELSKKHMFEYIL